MEINFQIEKKMKKNFSSKIASNRVPIPRKSLNYKTPLDVYLTYAMEDDLSSLIGEIIKTF